MPRPRLSLTGPITALLTLSLVVGGLGAGPALAYTAGFALATAALHLAGLGLARLLPDTRAGRLALRVGGGAIAGAGVVLLGA